MTVGGSETIDTSDVSRRKFGVGLAKYVSMAQFWFNVGNLLFLVKMYRVETDDLLLFSLADMNRRRVKSGNLDNTILHELSNTVAIIILSLRHPFIRRNPHLNSFSAKTELVCLQEKV